MSKNVFRTEERSRAEEKPEDGVEVVEGGLVVVGGREGEAEGEVVVPNVVAEPQNVKQLGHGFATLYQVSRLAKLVVNYRA